MKLLVFGNIGAGKTSIISILKSMLNFEVLAIDDFRRSFGDGSKTGELFARRKFFESISIEKNQIIESIGVGRVADDLFELLKNGNESIICLVVKVPKEICFNRLSNRIWDIPFHLPIENVNSLVERTHNAIENEEIQRKWSPLKKISFIVVNNQDKNDFESIVSLVSTKALKTLQE